MIILTEREKQRKLKAIQDCSDKLNYRGWTGAREYFTYIDDNRLHRIVDKKSVVRNLRLGRIVFQWNGYRWELESAKSYRELEQ